MTIASCGNGGVLYGFEAEEIPMQEVQNETVSSTRIRQALSEGYIQRANAYLDHFYIIIGAAAGDDSAIFSLRCL
ncbi:MAG: hypothetical protein MZV63_05565 [Marinilabiliales bacterium]|nr:hypothetical protein [Marinilabiliales bacterium]